MAISAKAMLTRLQQVTNPNWLENQVEQIVLSDQKRLKEEKIDEFTHGVRPDGRRIGQYRDAEYAIFKHQINPLADGYVDLLLTRQFSSRLFVKPYNKGFIFDSSDDKTDNLVGKYGLDIMGLNQDTFNQRQKDIYRFVLIKDIQKILNK